MAIYSFSDQSFQALTPTSFTAEKILERSHLQAALKTHIDVIAPECLVISEEFSSWSEGQRRIDLLAIDKDANLVVIELKRSDSGDHMELQALRYAAMVSTLTFGEAVETYKKYLNLTSEETQITSEETQTKILDFLGWEEPQEEKFALDTRIVLVSSNFSVEITTTVMWLNEREMDIRCVRLIPYRYLNSLLIDVQQIIPLPEAEEYRIKIKHQSEERREAKKSQRDMTRYRFNGVVYNKKNLVFAVIKEWIRRCSPPSYNELLNAFPQDLHVGGLFADESHAKEIYERYKIPRHFFKEDELIQFLDSDPKYAISNQWGKGNLEPFIEHAKKLEFTIEEVFS